MTDKEENASIEYILSQGLVKPPTFLERITKIFRVIGVKFIFWDLSYSLIFTFVTLSGVIWLFRHSPHEYQYSVALMFSPALFLLIMFFAEINERTCGLYELKQTCLYTSRQITAIRCVCYSAVGTVFAVFVTAFLAESAAQFFRLLPLCLGGLFLCASTELSLIRLLRSKWSVVIYTVAWLFMNLALPSAFREKWELLLSGLPVLFTAAIAILGIILFAYQTNKMLTEGNRYVNA